MKKTANVFTNDPNNPKVNLTISGQVEQFAVIRPTHVSLRGFTGKQLKGSVSIIPKKKYPFKILKVRARNGKDIKFKLEEFNRSGIMAYQLMIENLKKDPGRYFDVITLETDSKLRPQLEVKVYGFLRRPKNESP